MKALLFLFVMAGPVAEAADSSWIVGRGTLQYTLQHMLHTVHGVTKEVKGKGSCNPKCSFLVAALVKSFDSENANRDSNMQNFTKAALFPVVEVRTALEPSAGTKEADAEVSFAGKTHTYRLKLNLSPEGGRFRVRSEIPMKLSDFSIERPALLGVKVNDEVPVSVDLEITPAK